MLLPAGAVALLVQVHPHHERLAERPGNLDELLPGRVHAKDVADHQLPVARTREVHQLLRLRDGLGQRLLTEDVATRFDCRPRIRPVRFGIRVDADDVGPGRRERLEVVAERRHAA
jgi:hypothetical protein